MLKVEKYKENLRKLEEKYKDNKNSEYFKERVNLLVSDLEPQFPKDIAVYTHCIALDLTNGEGDFKYPKEVKDYFDVRGNNNEIGPSSRFDEDLINESIYNVDKCHQDNNIDVQDLQYLVKELNKIERIAQKLKLFKYAQYNRIFKKSIPYFIHKAKVKCFEHIERLNLPDNYEYREMESYCNNIVEAHGKYNAHDYNSLDIFEGDINYYIDQLISFPKNIVCDVEGKLLPIERKRNITKIEKFSWEYYQYAFEYLRSYFCSYCNKHIDYVEEQYIRVFEDFTLLIAFAVTKGKCKIYDYNLGSEYLEPELYFALGYKNYEDYFRVYDGDGPKIENINLIRYFWCNLNYLYNSICNNTIFTNIQKKYLKKYMENILEDISELIHTQGWY